MKKAFSYAMVLLAAVLLSGVLSGCGQKQEVLFNGEDLTGWVWFTKEAEPVVAPEGQEAPVPEAPAEETFSVKDGVLRVSGEPFGYIRTEKKYGDCTIHVEWRWAEGRVDSGIFVFLQDEDHVWPTGIQFQLRESDFGFLFSGLKLEGVEGPFCRKAPLCEGDPELEDGQWNETVIVCKGGHVTATVNGVLANEAQCEASEGYIGFQSEGGPIEFRHIYVTK
jgi:hypothetical protein